MLSISRSLSLSLSLALSLTHTHSQSLTTLKTDAGGAQSAELLPEPYRQKSGQTATRRGTRCKANNSFSFFFALFCKQVVCVCVGGEFIRNERRRLLPRVCRRRRKKNIRWGESFMWHSKSNTGLKGPEEEGFLLKYYQVLC